MGIPFSTSAYSTHRHPHQIVFLGSLEERMGTEMLLPVLEQVRQRIPDATLHIIGDGPYRTLLEESVHTRGLEDSVVMHGFVESQGEVQIILCQSSVGVAPYVPSPDNFTQFADPGKIKAYVSAGLPIVLTAVPPNSQEMAERGFGLVRDYNAEQLAGACVDLMTNSSAWTSAHDAASKYASSFQWPQLLKPLFDTYL